MVIRDRGLRLLRLAALLAVAGTVTVSVSSTSPLAQAVGATFVRSVIDGNVVPNGHKPKAIADLNGDGFNDVVAYTSGQGLSWYSYPTWSRFKINGGGDGEQAQAADLDGDGDIDIVVGGIWLPARWYENPLRQGGNPAAPWQERVIGGSLSHDLEISDVNRDGKLDVTTQDGIYVQVSPTSWTLVDNAHFPGRAGQGTALGDVDRNGFPDLVDASSGQLVWYQNPLPGEPVTGRWTRRVIAPGFTEDAVAVADLNGDGRPDVLLANEYGSGGLQWFKAPDDPRTGSWVPHMIDASVNAVHQSSILVGDVDLDGTPDVVVAEQEQSSTDRLIAYYNTARNGLTWNAEILATSGGHNPKLGDIDNDGDLDVLNANHGYFGAPNPVELFRNQRSSGGSTTTTTTAAPTTTTTVTTTTTTTGPVAGVQDDFSGSGLDPAWSFVNPLSDASGGLDGNGHLVLVAPADSEHDCWTVRQTCPRLMRPAGAGDAVYETKIDGDNVTRAYQAYGIILWQDSANFVRFEIYSDWQGVKAAAWRVIGGSGSIGIVPRPTTLGPANYIRVTRSNAAHTMQLSQDGQNWTTIGSFTQSGFTVRQMGLSATNSERLTTTARFDYFRAG